MRFRNVTPKSGRIASFFGFYRCFAKFCRRSVLTFGFVTPMTGPRPFNYEWLLLFNSRFGGSRTGRSALPMLGG
jgi:hypothetical protein